MTEQRLVTCLHDTYSFGIYSSYLTLLPQGIGVSHRHAWQSFCSGYRSSVEKSQTATLEIHPITLLRFGANTGEFRLTTPANNQLVQNTKKTLKNFHKQDNGV